MIVRPYRRQDASALSALYRRSVEALGARAYAPAQVSAWAARAPRSEALEAAMSDGRARFVAEGRDGAPAAFADVRRGGLLQYLYAAPEAPGTGAASAALAAAEAEAAGWGLFALRTKASEAAIGFFERHGWTRGQRRDLALDGVAIRNRAATKRLDAGA